MSLPQILLKIAVLGCLFLHVPSMAAFDLNMLKNQLQAPDNVQGQFKQEKHLRALNRPLLSEGEFVLLPNKGLLWTLKKPFVSTTRIQKTGIQQWSENQKKWTASGQKIDQNNQVALFLGLLGGETKGLNQDFDIVLTGQAKKWHMILMPKTLIIKQIFSKIEVEGGYDVTQIILEEKQGDRTVIRFVNTKTNQTINSFAQNALLH